MLIIQCRDDSFYDGNRWQGRDEEFEEGGGRKGNLREKGR